MLTIIVIPEITKGADLSIIYLLVNVSSQMEFLFFFNLKGIFTYFSILV